jgi:hypothetical protein
MTVPLLGSTYKMTRVLLSIHTRRSSESRKIKLFSGVLYGAQWQTQHMEQFWINWNFARVTSRYMTNEYNEEMLTFKSQLITSKISQATGQMKYLNLLP